MNSKKCFILAVTLLTFLIGLNTTLWGQEQKDPAEKVKLLEEKIKDLEGIVEQQQKKINDIEAAYNNIKNQLDEQIKENERLKTLCKEAGIVSSTPEKTNFKPPLPSEKRNEPNQSGKIKAISKPIFGIRLGEDIADLEIRYPVKSIPANEFEETTKTYIVENKFSEVKDLRVWCFNNKIYCITVFLNNSSESNCNTIVKEIKTKYKVIKETIEEKPTSLPWGKKATSREYVFQVRTDGEDITISILLDIFPKELGENDLVIQYIYDSLDTLVQNEYKGRKAFKIGDEL